MKAVLLILAIATTAYAGARDWSGSGPCGTCHPKELAAWQATPHAKTRARFVSAPPRACLACHATGEAPAGPVVAVEVGCEACHGAGAAYGEDDIMRDRSLSLALGLTDVSTPKARAAICAACHARQTSGKKFDPMAAVHPVKP